MSVSGSPPNRPLLSQNLRDQSLLEVAQLDTETIRKIFEKASRLRRAPVTEKGIAPKVLGLLFFEPSTRTRTSFEMACHRLGIRALNFDVASSSVTKGETIEDTALTVEALGVNALVVRHPLSGVCHRLVEFLKVPVINAGDGTREHPTQGLLDAYTIQNELGEIKGKKVLIVGDIRYSRVARSNMGILPQLGAEIGVCGPATLCPGTEETGREFRVFRNFEEGLEWADVCMMLRMQTERQNSYEVPSLREFAIRFGLNAVRLKKLSPKSIIMHPGPFNKGIELTDDVLRDPRQRILKQVENGVFIRAALLSEIMGVDV